MRIKEEREIALASHVNFLAECLCVDADVEEEAQTRFTSKYSLNAEFVLWWTDGSMLSHTP